MSEPLDLLTLEQAAEALGFTTDGHKDPVSAARLLCRQRKLRYAKIGGRVKVCRKWLVDYVESQAVETL